MLDYHNFTRPDVVKGMKSRCGLYRGHKNDCLV